jgi:hypothetical protein
LVKSVGYVIAGDGRFTRVNRQVDFVLRLFSYAGMWTRADELRLSVVMGLRAGLKLIRGMRRSLTEEEQHKIAKAIVEHLERSNWKIEQGPPAEGHGQYIIPPR